MIKHYILQASLYSPNIIVQTRQRVGHAPQLWDHEVVSITNLRCEFLLSFCTPASGLQRLDVCKTVLLAPMSSLRLSPVKAIGRLWSKCCGCHGVATVRRLRICQMRVKQHVCIATRTMMKTNSGLCNCIFGKYIMTDPLCDERVHGCYVLSYVRSSRISRLETGNSAPEAIRSLGPAQCQPQISECA